MTPVPGREDLRRENAPEKGRFQVLALDGGGLRGIFGAAALDQLEADFDTSILGHFDLIAGTSTGGLIALALAAGRSPGEILDIYLREGPNIFPTSRWARLRRLMKPYSPEPLLTAVTDILGDNTLEDSPVRLVIPAFDLTSNDVYVFRTPHIEKLRRDRRDRMIDVAMSTTAAPTFLPSHELAGLRLIDGGVWANNPTMVAVVESLSACQQPPESVHVLNIGTTSEIVHRSRRLDKGSAFWWIREIVDVAFRGQALSATNHAGLLLPKGHVHRLDVPVPKGLHGLDRVDAQNLVGNAKAASRKASPALSAFFSHRAISYKET